MNPGPLATRDRCCPGRSKTAFVKALTIRDLRKTYKNGIEALKGIDLDVTPGEFCGLLGPNGAGKSTAIGILFSLVNKTSGKLEVFGHDTDVDFPAAKQCMGLVPQEFNFNQFETSFQIVVNQAGYYGIERRVAVERAEVYLRKLGLWDRRNSISRTLSGGMKRRLMIARALVHEPQLLVLDEPTAGVDIELRRSMWSFLQEINSIGTTIILTTHYLEEAETLCKRIAIIDRGEIIENTPTKELVSRLHVESFVLDLAAPVETLPDVDGYTFKILDPETVEVQLSFDRKVNDLFEVLSTHGIVVRSLRNKANRLEELFVNLTGGQENHA